MAKIKKAVLPSDTNKRAKNIVELATNQTQDEDSLKQAVKEAAAALGRLGGLKGGPARAAKLSPKKRSEIAKKAAKARWGTTEDKKEDGK